MFISARIEASTKQDIDLETQKLANSEKSLVVDQKNAFDYLMKISNLSSGALLTANVVNAHPGDTVDMDITLAPGNCSVASIQSTLNLPIGVTLKSFTVGPAAANAGKQISSQQSTFLIFGLNQTIMNPGIVASAHLAIDPNAFKTVYSVGISTPVISDPDGHAVVVSGLSGSVVVN